MEDEAVGEGDRREMGDRERDREEPDAEDFDDEDDEDRLIDVLLLCCLGDGHGLTSTFAISGRGGGIKDFNDNVLMLFKETTKRKKSISIN